MTRITRGPCIESADAIEKKLPFEIHQVAWHPASFEDKDGEVKSFCRVLFISKDEKTVVSAGRTAYKALCELMDELKRTLPLEPPLKCILHQGTAKNNHVYHWLEPIDDVHSE